MVFPPSRGCVAGTRARSWVSAWTQFSRHPVKATLNFLGRLVKALSPTNMAVSCRATGKASNSSVGVSPATGRPTTLRILSIPVRRLVRPTSASRAETARMSWMRSQRSWICWRVVISRRPRPNSPAMAAGARSWVASVMPLVMRTRIMKNSGVCLRKNSPAHFRRSRSASVMACHPCCANAGISLMMSRPSFSALICSNLFMTPRCHPIPLLPDRGTGEQGCCLCLICRHSAPAASA